MKTRLLGIMMSAALVAPLAVPTAALARDHSRDRYGYDRGHDRGRHGDYRWQGDRNDGTTGLVIGAIGGGLLGNAVGGNTLGTLLGAGGGALLGRSIDRGNVRCR